MNGNEPSDAIRVVNAVLTQIDRLKAYPNCVIMTTSNLTGALGAPIQLLLNALLTPRKISLLLIAPT